MQSNLVRVVRIHPAHQLANSNWLLDVLQRCASHSGYVADETYWSEVNSHRTVVKPQIPFFQNFQMFIEVLQQGALIRPDLKTNWHPRVRLSVDGGTVDGAVFAFRDIAVFPHLLSGSPVGDLTGFKVGCYLHPTSGLFVLGPNAVQMLKDLYRLFPSGFKHTASYVSEGVTREVEQRFTWRKHSSDHFRLNFYGIVRPKVTYIGKSYRTYDFDIFIKEDGAITVMINSGRFGALTAGEVETGTPSVVSSEYFTQVCNYQRNAHTGFASQILMNCDASVMRFTPLLFHTQSLAVKNFLQDVSRNFETLTEAAGFFPAVWDIVKTPGRIGGSWLNEYMPIVDRVQTFLKLLAGGYLAYKFAVDPTLKTVSDMLKTITGQLRQIGGEGQIVYQGETEDAFNALPQGLRNFLTQLTSRQGTVLRYEVRVRTQITQDMSMANVVNLANEYVIRSSELGIIPSPTQLYKAQPMTFLLDMLIPVGQLIESAEYRARAFGVNSVWLGHTVFVSVWTSNGNLVRLFIRSTATDRYLDPQGDSWLMASGVPVSVSVPLAATILL